MKYLILLLITLSMRSQSRCIDIFKDAGFSCFKVNSFSDLERESNNFSGLERQIIYLETPKFKLGLFSYSNESPPNIFIENKKGLSFFIPNPNVTMVGKDNFKTLIINTYSAYFLDYSKGIMYQIKYDINKMPGVIVSFTKRENEFSIYELENKKSINILELGETDFSFKNFNPLYGINLAKSSSTELSKHNLSVLEVILLKILNE